MTTLVCARCQQPIEPASVVRDPSGQTYHRTCLASVDRQRVVITGIEVGVGDLVVLLLKLGLAGIPAGIMLGVIWYVLALFLR